LTDNLAVKLPININILVPEKVNIIIFKKARYIRSCEIDIKLKAILKKGIAKLLICVIARIIIPLFAFIAIPIYYIAIAEDKDLLFKLNNTLVTLFV
jgi:hypothetical protein